MKQVIRSCIIFQCDKISLYGTSPFSIVLRNFQLQPYDKMATSDNVEEVWKAILNETISCVLDDSPNDAILASYLGKGVENKYRVLN